MAPFVSGAMLVLAFPAYDHGWLVWVGLVPFSIALARSGLKYSIFLSFICGLVFFPGVFYWILSIRGYKLAHHATLGLYLGSYFLLFGLGFGLVSRRFGSFRALLSAPFIWVGLEYIRSNLSFLALPWALLGHSQYQYPGVIQIASFTGTYGISFLIVLVNVTLTAVVLAFFNISKKKRRAAFASPSKREASALAIMSGVLVLGSLVYGEIMLNEGSEGEKLKVSVIQGDIEQKKKWDRKYERYIMKRYVELSRKAAESRPDLIIWPETATPGYVFKKIDILNQIISLARETKCSYLVGSAEYPKFERALFNPKKGGNTAVLFSRQGKILGQYLKIRLVPFKEYIPFEGVVPWPDFIVPEKKATYLIQGKKPVLLGFDTVKFGTLICWESIFPQLAREFARKGANFIINITNEAWFSKTSYPYQSMGITIFRAVENRLPIVRVGNTGVSCFIDQYGRVTDKLQVAGKAINVKGHLTREITLCKKKTFYAIYGDLLAYLALIVSFVMIGFSFGKPKE